jgi:hypothetical protein
MNFKAGQILVKLKWDDTPYDEIKEAIKNKNITQIIAQFGRGIIIYQRDMLKIPIPASYSTHVEMIKEVDGDVVKTYSQQETVKVNTYTKSELIEKMSGIDFPIAILEPDWEMTPEYLEGCWEFWETLKGKEKKGWKKWLSSLYDIGSIVMYVVNFVRQIMKKEPIQGIGSKKREVCSSAVAGAERLGLDRMGLGQGFIFKDLEVFEVAPAHLWLPFAKHSRKTA